jgi:polysaccharide biosynthesis transport protein
VPEPSKRVASKNRLVTLAEPSAAPAEAFRLLRTNLDFVSLDRDVRTILVTSATQGEGKSTTAANLAVTLGRAGRNVALVDLDLRRPSLHRFFDLELGRMGATTVALGQDSLDEALAPVHLGRQSSSSVDGESFASNGDGHGGRSAGSLHVLQAGPLPPDPGEFIETSSIGGLIEELRRRAEIVIIDTPPLLTVGDALTLSSRVDALLVVTRLTTLRKPALRELHRVLEVSPARKLGFVLTGSEAEHGYGAYGSYGYDAYNPARPEKSTPEPVA